MEQLKAPKEERSDFPPARRPGKPTEIGLLAKPRKARTQNRPAAGFVSLEAVADPQDEASGTQYAEDRSPPRGEAKRPRSEA